MCVSFTFESAMTFAFSNFPLPWVVSTNRKADKQDAVCFYHSDQSQTASLHLQRWKSRTALMTHMELCFIHMSSSALCPVVRGKGHVMSAAEMPREEWLMSHTVSTYPVLQRPPPVSSPVANGVPESGLPWVKTYTLLCPIITDVFSMLGTSSNLFFFPSKQCSTHSGHLVLIWGIIYWMWSESAHNYVTNKKHWWCCLTCSQQ